MKSFPKTIQMELKMTLYGKTVFVVFVFCNCTLSAVLRFMRLLMMQRHFITASLKFLNEKQSTKIFYEVSQFFCLITVITIKI